MTAEQTKLFQRWQWRTILGTMIGYAIFYFVRKNFSFAIPSLTAEYGISKTNFGIIMTLVGLIYGLSKFVNGILADRTNGRWHLVTGLAVCTVVNFIFGCGAFISEWLTGESYGASFFSALVILFSILLIINNIFQGCGFPPCNRLITHWVPPQELATKMSIWNTSHSIGAGIMAIMCGYIMSHTGVNMTGNAEMTARITQNLGINATPERVSSALEHIGAWQWSFWIPAAIGVLGVLFIIVTLRDTPKSVGLPELGTKLGKPEKEESSAEFKAFLRKNVFMNPVIWMLALADFFVYIVRFAVLDWGPTFLQESSGLSSSWAGWTIAIFELFGITGMLLAGWATDRFLGGKAHRTCAICMAFVVLFVSVFCFLPDSAHPLTRLFILAAAGFFLYGPQALIGVVASNHATRKAASTANGVIGMVSYVSVAVSGAGFGFISDHWGWHYVFYSMIGIAIIGFLVMASMWKMKRDAYDQIEA